MLVGVGLGPAGYVTDFEVVSLSKSGKRADVPNFPVETLSPLVGFYNGDRIMICGGHNATIFSSECYYLQDQAWLAAPSMTTPRYDHRQLMVSIPCRMTKLIAIEVEDGPF